MLIECAAQLSVGAAIDAPDLHLESDEDLGRPGDASPLFLMAWDEARDEFQRQYLRSPLQRTGTRRGWVNRAAEFARMGRDGSVKALRRLELYPCAAEGS